MRPPPVPLTLPSSIDCFAGCSPSACSFKEDAGTSISTLPNQKERDSEEIERVGTHRRCGSLTDVSFRRGSRLVFPFSSFQLEDDVVPFFRCSMTEADSRLYDIGPSPLAICLEDPSPSLGLASRSALRCLLSRVPLVQRRTRSSDFADAVPDFGRCTRFVSWLFRRECLFSPSIASSSVRNCHIEKGLKRIGGFNADGCFGDPFVPPYYLEPVPLSDSDSPI